MPENGSKWPDTFIRKYSEGEENLRDLLLNDVKVMSREESRGFFKPDDFRWAETLLGDDSPTGEPTVHINYEKYENETGKEVSDEFRDKIVLAESLHTLKNKDPDLYKDLVNRGMSEPQFREWVVDSYKKSIRGEDPFPGIQGLLQREQRNFGDWLSQSRFDQIIGGYLFAGDEDFPTMKDWSREELPFGAHLTEALEQIRNSLELP